MHTLRWPAAAGERFAPGCLDGMLGKPLAITGLPVTVSVPQALVTGYTVAEDGSWLDLELWVGQDSEPGAGTS